ncbi:biopolymer transporter ExbD [bacterium]|nr:biopolymer transporter ExbD [bacterium]
MMVEKRKERTVEIPTSSMADIAFLLLAFFLVTTSLDLDKGLKLALPPVGDVKPMPKKNIASILINDEGEILLDEEPIDIAQIRDVIKQRLAENELLTVSIKTTENTRYQVFVSVLDQVQLAEAKRISIAEPEK